MQPSGFSNLFHYTDSTCCFHLIEFCISYHLFDLPYDLTFVNLILIYISFYNTILIFKCSIFNNSKTLYAFVTQLIFIFGYLLTTYTIYICILLLMRDFSLLLEHLKLCFVQSLLQNFKLNVFSTEKISTGQA